MTTDGTSKTKLYIRATHLLTIRADAEARYPEECCGIMYGSFREDGGREVLETESIRNEFEESERYHRFEITAEQMMRAERRARQEGLEVVGFYHSHPDCEAIPSEYDRSHALPVYSYLIVSCKEGKAEYERSWVIDLATQQFIEEEIY